MHSISYMRLFKYVEYFVIPLTPLFPPDEFFRFLSFVIFIYLFISALRCLGVVINIITDKSEKRNNFWT